MREAQLIVFCVAALLVTVASYSPEHKILVAKTLTKCESALPMQTSYEFYNRPARMLRRISVLRGRKEGVGEINVM
jgi:hypothetical protein